MRWARGRAIALDPLGPDISVERLAPLDDLLSGKRIVFLGEFEHFVHEKYDYRLLFLRYLYSRGFRIVGEELGWSDGKRVDAFLEHGDPSSLERVCAYGYRGSRRSDRDDAATGLLADILDAYPEAAFRAEQVRFARALRGLSDGCDPSERVRFFGFDVDYEPSQGYELVSERLAGWPHSDALAPIRELLARVPGESLDQEIGRLARAVDAIARCKRALEDLLGTECCAELVRAVRTLHRSHAYVRIAHPARDLWALSPALALREQLMHEHVDWVLARAGSGAKVVLLGHDLHLARDDRGIRPRLPGGPGGGRVASLGTHLCQRDPESVLSVWMIQEHSLDSGAEGRGTSRTLNALLPRVGPAYVLPTGSREPGARALTRPRKLAITSGQRVRLALSQQADVLCFVREVSPLRAQ